MHLDRSFLIDFVVKRSVVLGDECLLSQETLIRTEFYPSFVDAEYVVEYEKLCDSAQSRPMCEQYRPS